jgi:aspartyl-tRNA(Asn)/glutamyl-tRNA(Gln) amidotransferase subunit A
MANMDALNETSLSELSPALARGDICSRDIVEQCLAAIELHDAKLHAFVKLDADSALALADAADAQRRQGCTRGPLHGLPVVLKDLIEVAGEVTTLGSKHFERRRSQHHSATLERLLAAGMIPLGKVHMTEFAFGGWGTNPLMGTPHNPWDLNDHRAPGGSSSGTGVAVAAGFCPAGIGSDTGGSVRIPSAFNGITGLKVTHGRISLHETGLLSWTLDTIGPMALSVQDCAWMLQALAAPDPRDPTTLNQPLEDFGRLRQDVRGMRIAMVEDAQLPSFMASGVVANWRDAAKVLASAGAKIDVVRLPDWFFSLAQCTGRIIASEAYHLHEAYVHDEKAALGEAVRARILSAEAIKAADYAAELRQMQQRRRAFSTWFQDYEALLLPTVASVAPVLPIDESSPLPGYLTRPINYLGLCALAQPSGLSQGMPTSVQWVGKAYDEGTIMAIAATYEHICGHHRMRPKRSD